MRFEFEYFEDAKDESIHYCHIVNSEVKDLPDSNLINSLSRLTPSGR